MTTNTIQARWYVIDNLGGATLCANEQDAQEVAHNADIVWPKSAPHRVAQLAPVQPAMPADADLNLDDPEDACYTLIHETESMAEYIRGQIETKVKAP